MEDSLTLNSLTPKVHRSLPLSSMSLLTSLSLCLKKEKCTCFLMGKLRWQTKDTRQFQTTFASHLTLGLKFKKLGKINQSKVLRKNQSLIFRLTFINICQVEDISEVRSIDFIGVVKELGQVGEIKLKTGDTRIKRQVVLLDDSTDDGRSINLVRHINLTQF
jgi:hypothetical protein